MNFVQKLGLLFIFIALITATNLYTQFAPKEALYLALLFFLGVFFFIHPWIIRHEIITEYIEEEYEDGDQGMV